MSRTAFVVAGLVACAWSAPAMALSVPKLFEAGGTVHLSDGGSATDVSVEVRIDLTRDGTISSFERASGKTGAEGSWSIPVKPDVSSVSLSQISELTSLANAFNKGGFDALLDGRPMRGTILFSKRGYSTVVKNFNAQSATLALDAVMTPLSPIGCSEAGCQTPSGDLSFVGLDPAMGIAEASGRSYDPTLDRSRFPGSFAEKTGDVLISSGFMELDLRDADGNPITSLSEPLLVRWRIDPVSWPTLVDAAPGNDRVDLQLYSFDAGQGSWLAESQGWLERADGSEVTEAELPAFVEGKATGALFAAAELSHFSYWNVDRPAGDQTCVRGRIVDAAGAPVVGADVIAEGISYTGESVVLTTGADGKFVAALMKSEDPGQDVDGNGETGEKFTAQLVLSVKGQIGFGAVFETPHDSSKIVEAYEYICSPASCPCFDVGDVVFEPVVPTICTVRLHVRASGESLILWGGTDDSVPKGTPLASLGVSGSIDTSMPIDTSTLPECANGACGFGATDADGRLELLVPTVEGYRIQVSAASGSYSGAVTIESCGKDPVDVVIEASYYDWGSIGDFTSATWGIGSLDGMEDDASFCACTGSRGPADLARGALGGALLLLAVLGVRRRRA